MFTERMDFQLRDIEVLVGVMEVKHGWPDSSYFMIDIRPWRFVRKGNAIIYSVLVIIFTIGLALRQGEKFIEVLVNP